MIVLPVINHQPRLDIRDILTYTFVLERPENYCTIGQLSINFVQLRQPFPIKFAVLRESSSGHRCRWGGKNTGRRSVVPSEVYGCIISHLSGWWWLLAWTTPLISTISMRRTATKAILQGPLLIRPMIHGLRDLSRLIPNEQMIRYWCFSGTEILGVTPEQLGFNRVLFRNLSLGLNFVRGMVDKTHPTTACRTVGFKYHSTDVWIWVFSSLIKEGIALWKPLSVVMQG